MIRSKYPWPASGLNTTIMHQLYQEKIRSGTPISQLIVQAVLHYLQEQTKRTHP